MASSNRHWPSMFKSKPHHHHHHHQWQHDHINSSLISTPAFHRGSPFSSGCEERSPEPKPRWNPKPEQIRILEAIFNSGMVNPPRDEIRKIRAQLQEYGQVGDANVFYWFQNRKSRSKHKNRHHALQNPNKTATYETQNPKTTSSSSNNISIIPSSSSSSSDNKSSPQDNTVISSPTVSINHQPPYFFTQDPFLFQMQQQQQQQFSQGFCFSDLSNVVQMDDDHDHQQHQEPVGGFLLSELMLNSNNGGGLKKVDEEEKMKLQHELGYSNAHHHVSSSSSTTVTPIQGVGESDVAAMVHHRHNHPLVGSERSTVFINEVAFEVSVGGFNVRECFGDDAVLIHSSGQPVLTNEWGLTIQPLIHGASYYLI